MICVHTQSLTFFLAQKEYGYINEDSSAIVSSLELQCLFDLTFEIDKSNDSLPAGDASFLKGDFVLDLSVLQ